jgi:hypothetical protein
MPNLTLTNGQYTEICKHPLADENAISGYRAPDPNRPELIEIGLDVLNPVQPASMDPANIKKKYGDKLCFWGTIDEQYTLPFGSPQDVANEVKLRLEIVGYNGGLILAPTFRTTG